MAIPIMVSYALVGVANAMSNILVESLVDTTVDYVIDGIDEAMQKAMPNFESSYMKQFTNQVRMGAATATNARIMGAALKSQNKFEGRMDLLRQKSKEKYNRQRQGIKDSTLALVGEKRALDKLKNSYDKEMERLDRSSDRYTKIRSSSATEANAFSNGTGALKTGHDGTIQNLKGNPNADLVVSINRLLNGLGNYENKEGVLAI
ncbi:hypothetical protein [Psychrilyobacter atlanticus]|uniref:hypothetical protein n=1 Tax=Psychrilyobacter atlanticus TaxID=271091 RepID=UPI000421BDA5|nr:hypothetical protein [Psychrilyobacter atlanticus]